MRSDPHRDAAVRFDHDHRLCRLVTAAKQLSAAQRVLVRDMSAETAYLARALEVPSLRASAGRRAERARAEWWTHENIFRLFCNARSPPRLQPL
jgi:hypothetical protein